MITIPLTELQPDKKICRWINNKEVVLVLHNDQVLAYSGICPHQGGPLEQGTIIDKKLICPWHNCVFDLTTGTCIDTGLCKNITPEKIKLPRFKCTVKDNIVYVDENVIL